MNTIRIIADVHQKYSDYLKIIKGCEYSIQIGDLGYDNKFIEKSVDCNKHKFFPGNHDNHKNDYNLKNCLGRFGQIIHNDISLFYIAGGFSIDKEYRKQAELSGYKKTYFENEELNYREGMECLEQYEARKPDIVLSHEAPRFIVNKFTDGGILRNFGYDPETFTTNTSELLDQLYKIHQPELWIFAHYHKSWKEKIGKTLFILLPELGYMDVWR